MVASTTGRMASKVSTDSANFLAIPSNKQESRVYRSFEQKEICGCFSVEGPLNRQLEHRRGAWPTTRIVPRRRCCRRRYLVLRHRRPGGLSSASHVPTYALALEVGCELVEVEAEAPSPIVVAFKVAPDVTAQLAPASGAGR